MIKQELIEDIKNIDAVESFMSETIWVKRNDVLALAYQLDEPEKVVLTKEEAEWLEKLKEYRGKNKYHNKYDTLYFIARAGFSHIFSFYDDNGEVELTEYKDFNDTKERLTKALLYGYEVEREKLYKVSLKKNGIGIGVQQQDGSLKEQFTKTELSEYGFDNLDEYETEEVEE